MNEVDSIAKRVAGEKAQQIVNEIVRDFDCDADWIKSWAPRYRRALVGDRDAPHYSAEQIQRAFDDLMQGWKYSGPPKPAHLVELARELVPLRPMQKPPTQVGERHYSPEARAANLAFVDAINAKIEEQNQDPAYLEAYNTHGRGSPELKAVVERQSGELQRWVKENAPGR